MRMSHRAENAVVLPKSLVRTASTPAGDPGASVWAREASPKTTISTTTTDVRRNEIAFTFRKRTGSSSSHASQIDSGVWLAARVAINTRVRPGRKNAGKFARNGEGRCWVMAFGSCYGRRLRGIGCASLGVSSARELSRIGECHYDSNRCALRIIRVAFQTSTLFIFRMVPALVSKPNPDVASKGPLPHSVGESCEQHGS